MYDTRIYNGVDDFGRIRLISDKMKISIKRIYDEPSEADGYRVLVDRLWPRGIKKDAARIDLWEKNIAPSNELRKWFAHDVNKWDEFCERYKHELENNDAFSQFSAEMQSKPAVTLLFAAKDTEHNNAVVLCSLLKH